MKGMKSFVISHAFDLLMFLAIMLFIIGTLWAYNYDKENIETWAYGLLTTAFICHVI